MCTYVLFRTFSEIELFHCTAAKLLILRIVSNIGIYCSNDKVGTVYLVQCIFENSAVSIGAFYNSCEDTASDCILAFLYAGDNIHYEIEQFVSCVHFCSVHFTPHPTPQTKI